MIRWLRGRRLGWLAEMARVDAWCLAIKDGPVPFWPADHPAELEYVAVDRGEITNT